MISVKSRPVVVMLLGLTGILAASTLFAQTATNALEVPGARSTGSGLTPLAPLPPPLPSGLSRAGQPKVAAPPKPVVVSEPVGVPALPTVPTAIARPIRPAPIISPPVADLAP